MTHFALLTFPLANDLIYYSVAAAAASFTAIRASIFRLLSWTKDQWLSMDPPDFQHQFGTAEVHSFVN